MTTKQFDNFADLITFTRASTGTYLDSDGLLKTATTNTPRIEYDANGNRKGLLIEEARTNLLTNSNVQSGAWAVISVTKTNLSENALGIFDGVSIASSGNTWNRIQIDGSVASGTTYTGSAWVREGTSGRLRLTFRDNIAATETLLAGTFSNLSIISTLAGNAQLVGVEDFGGGIFRVSVSFTPNFTGDFRFGIGPDSAVAGETVIAYGGQFEAGSFPTSYIPTSGSTATRSADVASIPTSAFGYNQKAGTVYIEGASSNYQSNRIFQIDDGTNLNRIFFLNGSDRRFYWQRSIGGAGGGGAGSFNPVSDGTPIKFAGAYSDGDWAAALDETLTTGTPAGLPIVDRLNIGSGSNVTGAFNGHIKSIQYYPRRLTNAQLQRLTT